MTFGVNFAGAAVLLTFYPQLQLPVWGLILAVMLAVVFLVPIGVCNALCISFFSSITRPRSLTF